MTVPLAALVFLLRSGPGDVPRLGQGELVRLAQGGGRLGDAGQLVVMEDGLVRYGWSQRGQRPVHGAFRLSRNESESLRRLVSRTDFAALRREPRVETPPSAYDGLDQGIAVRQGRRVEGWSNTLWRTPRHEPPLFARLRALVERIDRSSVLAGVRRLALTPAPLSEGGRVPEG